MIVRRNLCVLVVVTMVLAVGLWLCIGREGHADSTLPNILIVTFDTTRADHFRCFGNDAIETPAIDGLAERGIRYTHCLSPAPITLPSHTSIMTGLYPFYHKLRDNGMGPLDANIVTLAEVLRERGYRTGAVIAAHVLSSDYGIQQGFEHYGEDSPEMIARMSGHFPERTADSVTRDAASWLNSQDEAPFFLWVHYFDPHAPYEAPGTNKSDTPPEKYAKEIEYTDKEMAKLLARFDEVSARGQRETLIVFTADHGEALGQHGEPTHGVFAYNETIRAPLVLKLPNEEGRGRVMNNPVSLVDIYPFVLDRLGIALPYEIHGQPLPLPDGASKQTTSRPLYFETILPLTTYGWSKLEGLVVGSMKYIRAPTPELYDLSSDPGELHNLANEKPDELLSLERKLADLMATTLKGPTFVVKQGMLDEENIRKLESLGYAGKSMDQLDSNENRRDPKEMVRVLLLTYKARELLDQGEVLPAAKILNKLANVDPANHHVRALLDEISQSNVIEKMGDGFVARGKFSDAIDRYRLAFEIDNRRDELLTKIGNSFVNQGIALARQGFNAKAKSAFESGIKIEPSASTAHYNMAITLGSEGDTISAIKHYERALILRPEYDEAAEKLAGVYVAERKFADAIRVLRNATEHTTDNSKLFCLLAKLLATCQDDVLRNGPDAIRAARRACELTGYQHPDALATLAAAFAETGRFDEAVEHAQRAIDLAQARGDVQLASKLQLQLDVYRESKPYRDSAY